MTDLENGDEVEIIRSRAQTPPAAWEGLVVTGRARVAIRRATRMAVRKQYAGLGRRIVERLIQRAKREYSDEQLTGALPRLARASIDDVFAAVGRGEMRPSDVGRAMYPDYKEERIAAVPPPKSETGWFGLRKAKAVKFKVPTAEQTAASIPIRGLNSDLPVRFAPNGGAVPGDRIVGIHASRARGSRLSDPVADLERFRGDAGAAGSNFGAATSTNAIASAFRVRIGSSRESMPGTLAQIARSSPSNDANIARAIDDAPPRPTSPKVQIDLEV